MNTSDRQNLFRNIPSSIPDEIFETIISTPALKIERIILKGQKSAPDFWYDQEQSEWILACIIHDILGKFSKALSREQSGDFSKKQSVFRDILTIRIPTIDE